MHKRKLGIRLISSPFIFGILLIAYLHGFILHFIRFIRYGGEWLTYQKEDPARMSAIYKLLKENYEKDVIIPQAKT